MTFVTITRREDPLEGERVQVLRRWRRQQGRVDLLVVLANGRKRLIPQAWTDAEPAGHVVADEDDPAATLGAVEDLSAAVVIVSALSRRAREEQAASQSTCEEDNDAACPAQSAPTGVPSATGHRAGAASRNRRGRSDSFAGTPDRQSGRGGRGAR
jgi:hypothetical protein